MIYEYIKRSKYELNMTTEEELPVRKLLTEFFWCINRYLSSNIRN